MSKLGGLITKIGASVWGLAKEYAGKARNFLAREADGLVIKTTSWIGRSCGCFAAATLVWTASGQVPIAWLERGTEVVVQSESTGELEIREVTHVIVTPGAALLNLEIRHASGQIETIATTRPSGC